MSYLDDYLLWTLSPNYILLVYDLYARSTISKRKYYLDIIKILIKKYPEECYSLLNSEQFVYKRHNKVIISSTCNLNPYDRTNYAMHFCMTQKMTFATMAALFSYIKILDAYVFLYLIKKNYINYEDLKNNMNIVHYRQWGNFLELGCYFPNLINWSNIYTDFNIWVKLCHYSTMKRIYKYKPHVFNMNCLSKDQLHIVQYYGNVYVTFEQCIHADYDKYVYMGVMNDYGVPNKIDKKIYKYIND